MWHIYQIIVDYLFPIVIIYVLNQSHGHWLFMMHYILQSSMSLKLNDENEILHSFDSLMENDLNVINEFSLRASNIRIRIKREFNGILYSLSFLKICEKKKT